MTENKQQPARVIQRMVSKLFDLLNLGGLPQILLGLMFQGNFDEERDKGQHR